MKEFFGKLGIVDISSFFDLVFQFVKFGLVGLSNTVISLSVYYVVIWFNMDWYMLGSILGFVISVANACFWSRRYVFTDAQEGFLKTLFRSYLAYGASFLLATLLLYIQVEQLGISKTIAPVLNLLLTIPLNFIVNKFWTFK